MDPPPLPKKTKSYGDKVKSSVPLTSKHHSYAREENPPPLPSKHHSYFLNERNEVLKAQSINHYTVQSYDVGDRTFYKCNDIAFYSSVEAKIYCQKLNNYDLPKAKQNHWHRRTSIENSRKSLSRSNSDLTNRRNSNSRLSSLSMGRKNSLTGSRNSLSGLNRSSSRQSLTDSGKKFSLRRSSVSGSNNDVWVRRQSLTDSKKNLSLRRSSVSGSNDDIWVRRQSLTDSKKNLSLRRNSVYGSNNDVWVRRNSVYGSNKDIWVKRHSVSGSIGDLSSRKNPVFGSNNNLSSRRNSILGSTGELSGRRSSLSGRKDSISKSRESLSNDAIGNEISEEPYAKSMKKKPKSHDIWLKVWKDCSVQCFSENYYDVYKQKALLEMNMYRLKHRSNILEINIKLAEFAQELAEQYVTTQKVDVNVYYNYGILYGKSIITSATTIIKDFYETNVKYNYILNKVSSKAAYSFTQLVWKSTKQVGIGVQDDGKYLYVVCIFSPKGNKKGEYKKNVHKWTN
uniref:SCP domain-containing protein n=1 Tax=Strongyloides papillosus TaxID=174720 RepID=A0A0N5C4W3_STREA